MGTPLSPNIFDIILNIAEAPPIIYGATIHMKQRLQEKIHIEHIAAIFNINPQEFRIFHTYNIHHQQYLVKLIGVLYRNQASYLYYPIVMSIEMQDLQHQPVLWAWKAWQTIAT